jgi:hypothetical protein
MDCSSNQLTKVIMSNCTALFSFICSENLITEIDFSGCKTLEVVNCSENQLTNINTAGCSALRVAYCSNNQLTALDFADSPDLNQLYCNNNLLTNLELKDYTTFVSLMCYDNKLQLSDLYAAHLLIEDPYYKRLGTQTLLPQSVNIEEELFTNQAVFGGTFTKYTIEKEGNPAPESDYIVQDGKLKFNTTGTYTVTMTNDAIISFEGYPAKVIATLEVVPIGVKESELSGIKVYPNPTTGELRMENGELRINSIEVFDVYGRKVSYLTTHISNQINISHLPAGIYLINISTTEGNVARKIVKL